MYHSYTAAVAGTGFIGPVHAEALKRLGVKVKGILGSTPEKSLAAARQMGLETGYPDFEAILRDAEVDAVHLAVPNVWHYEMARRALEAGKHVMCEKPLAMTSAETADLVQLAARSGLQAGVCYNIRYYPLNLEARDRIRRGDAGKVFSVVGSYVQDWLMYDTDYNWRVLAEQGGALRAVADIGTHWMDLVTSVTGLHVNSVFADLHTVHPVRHRPMGEIATFSGKAHTKMDREPIDIDTEDAGSILFRFEGGAKGLLWVSQITAGRKNCVRYEISGAKQALSWDSEKPNELWIGHRNEPNQQLIKDPGLAGGFAAHFMNYPGGHNEGFPDSFKQCFRAFYDAIDGASEQREFVYPTFEEGHKEVQLCEAILTSHQEQRWVHLR